MTVTAETSPLRPAFRERFSALVSRAAPTLDAVGLGFIVPLLRMAGGEPVAGELKALWQKAGIPLVGIVAFIALWGVLAPQVQTSLGAIPGPMAVAQQFGTLYQEHLDERQKEADFYAREEARNAKLIAEGHADRAKMHPFTGHPTYLDQIVTSLMTVGLGFVVASAIAIPLGILCGISSAMNGALNPLIQIFKPVSPLAWLPIVTMVVSALYANPVDWLPKALLISAITVTLCSLWPTLINTAVGVAAIDKDLVNVGRVLQLSTATTVRKVVLPSALPFIFTGLRLSLGVGWMVLIAAEMLAQNPGLGKFVWDEFQNGSSSSLARIICAVITVGFIGFLLDRVMLVLQSAFTYSATR